MNVFGFKLHHKTNKRLAKKIIKERGNNFYKRLMRLKDKKIGDIVSSCSGLNNKIKEIEAEYIYFGKKSKVLYDINFVMENGTCCSLYNCGVDLPISYKEAINKRERIIKEWKDNDIWGFSKRYSNIVINPDGTYVEGAKDS